MDCGVGECVDWWMCVHVCVCVGVCWWVTGYNLIKYINMSASSYSSDNCTDKRTP